MRANLYTVLVVFAMTLAVAVSTDAGQDGAECESRPNVILILADDKY